MALRINVSGQCVTVENHDGMMLSDLAATAGFPLNMQCGGQGACRGCRVKLLSGRFRVGVEDIVVTRPVEVRACKTTVLSDCAEVEVPDRALLKIGTCAYADFYAPRKNLFQPLDNAEGQLGLAVDIGTTTVATILVELSTGKILAREAAYNRQIELADNVISRIALCCDESNLQKLQRLVIQDTLMPMFSVFPRVENVTQIVFSGNTVMSHLALGLSPVSIGTLPFEPLTKVFRDYSASELGLSCCPNATVRIVPAIAGYVGGDVVSDLYVANLSNDRLELLVDIGTNGEMVLNDHGRLLATASAAGPAFEGAGLLHGCRAAPGVIEQIVCHADDTLEIRTIGGLPPVGLCGSVAVDFIATAFKTGLLNSMGRFDLERLCAADRLVQLDCCGMTVNACRIFNDPEIVITEFDVSQILKAKAAVYAGIRALLDCSGYQTSQIERLVLAGGFAAHLNIGHAVTLGMLPEIALETVDVIGNGSLAGAYAALGAGGVWDALQDVAERPETYHLASTGDFEDRFIDALAIPHLDLEEFPLSHTAG